MKKYARFIIPAVAIVVALGFLMVNLSSTLVYFNTPAELQAREAGDARLRLGGRVVPGSVVEEESTVVFQVEDCDTSVKVIHTGVPPQLFQEGIGVVVEGVWTGEAFESDTMLVKHDEQYRSDAEDYDQVDHLCSES
jgi:cytochrome c-type biogenesis protein CcmE